MERIPLAGVSIILCWSLFSPFASGEDELKKEAVLEGVDKARTAMLAFFEAETLEKASEHILNADRLEERLKTHYESYPWTAFEVLALRYGGGSEVKGKETYFVHNFDVVLDGGDRGIAVPVSLVQFGERFLVDWELYAQLMYNTFERFLEQKPEGEQTFRLNVHRGVALDEDRALPLEGDVLRLRAGWRPSVFFPGNLYAGSETDAGRTILESVPWENGIASRAVVKWSAAGERAYIEVTGLEVIDFSTPSVFGEEGL